MSMDPRHPLFFLLGGGMQSDHAPKTPAEAAIRAAQAATARVETFLAAARIATPAVAATILEQCQLAHMEAAAHYSEAARLASAMNEPIAAAEYVPQARHHWEAE